MKTSIKVLGLSLGLAFTVTAPATAAELKLMTGPQGGAWMPLGGQLKDMWEKAVAHLSVQALPGAGIANVRGIEEGKTDLGFGNSISTVDAIAGKPPFNKPHGNVCNVATLYPQYFQVVVRVDANVNSIKDLKGKGCRPAARQHRRGDHQAIAAGERVDLQRRQDELRVVYRCRDAGAGRTRGRLHARHHNPSSAVMDLAPRATSRLLDLADQLNAMKKLNPGYTLNTIPKGTYPKQDKDVQVIGYATHIVASCKLPEDTVYGMTKAIAQNTQQLSAIVKDIAD